MKDITRLVRFEPFDNYPVLEGYGALGDKVNKRLYEHWVQTGDASLNVEREILNVLIDGYNESHEEAEQ